MYSHLITSEEFIDDLYDRGKICLNAANMTRIKFKYRPYLALFIDGTFLVDENAHDDIVLQNMVSEFCIKYPFQKRMAKQYVSSSILKAVYHRAQYFDWYLPQYKIPNDLDSIEKIRLQKFLDRMSNHKCLSVTTLTTPKWFCFYSPDKHRFALFEDGILILSENSSYIESLPRDISLIHPDITMVEIVPDYYINAVYERALYIQPSAREIYILLTIYRMMEQSKIDYLKALNIIKRDVIKWHKMLFMDELTARQMIYSEYFRNNFMEEEKFNIDILQIT